MQYLAHRANQAAQKYWLLFALIILAVLALSFAVDPAAADMDGPSWYGIAWAKIRYWIVTHLPF